MGNDQFYKRGSHFDAPRRAEGSGDLRSESQGWEEYKNRANEAKKLLKTKDITFP
jgi:hypothetical protein